MLEINITRPDDWHVHLRDGAALTNTVADVASQFARAIVMPNLKPPVVSTQDARAYRERIVAATPPGRQFEPLMTLYLTDNTSVKEIDAAKDSGIVYGVKYYPAGATTHSDAGVTDIRRLDDTLSAMASHGLPLLVHGEVTDAHVDIFDREKVFIDTVLAPLAERHPRLKIVLEHITTADATKFVRDAPDNIAATITAHHLLHNRNAMFKGGIRPHYYCLPVLKREEHRQALITAATSGNPKFFLGTDSAPHPRDAKESACGCAGIYTAHAALCLYAQAFETHGALEKLEAFASHFGPKFYGLPRNNAKITLRKESWTVDQTLRFGDDVLVPYGAGELMQWRVL